MKNILTVLLLFIAPAIQAQYQGRQVTRLDDDLFRVLAIITVLSLVMQFILTFLKRVLEYRIKNRIIDKGLSDHLASSILQTQPKDDNRSTIKWICLLGASSVGLMIVYYTSPIDIHSFGIMAFSIAMGFLGYYFFVKHSEK